VVVLYHSVDYFAGNERRIFFNGVGGENRRSSNIEPGIFTRQIDFFKKNFNIISVPDMLSAKRLGKKIERPLVITFDDGYKSAYEFACTALKKDGIPAVIFICEDLVEGKMLPVSLRINFLFHNLDKKLLTYPLKDFFPAFYQSVKDKEDEKVYLDFLSFFRNNREKGRIEGYFSKLFEKAVISEQNLIKKADLYMGWQDIRNLDRGLFIIGNHGKRHYKLSSLSKEDIIEEVNSPIEKIKGISQAESLLYAVAYGAKDDFDEFAREEILRGHLCIFTAYGGINPQTLNLNDIRRIPMTSISDADDIYRAIYGWGSILK
jgi:peptidoglycan/xylan/chitin deacetylase (PgdA/CDA1 family)